MVYHLEVTLISKRSLLTRSAALVVILAAMLALAQLASAQDQHPGLTMSAEPAFGGYFKYGEWLPIWVQVENSGPDLEGELRVRIADSWGGTSYAAAAQLPTGSRKRIPLYVLPNNYSHALEVQLVADGTVLASQNVNVLPQPNINYLVGFIAPEQGALSQIKTISLPGQTRPLAMTAVSLGDLPERAEGLRSFDTLVLNATDTSGLTPGQQAALESWVRQGGRLVIGGGPEAAQTAAGLPRTLLPFEPGQVIEVDELPGLAGFAGGNAVRVPGPFAVATGQSTRESALLASQKDIPLVQEWALDGGSVDFIALDLATSPFDAWNGTPAFWETLVSPGAVYPQGIPVDTSVRQMRSNQMTYALSNLPSLDLPSIRSLAILLGIYVILVGPVNYLILRWHKRLHLAWVTIPVFTVAFSAGAFSLGYAMRGTDLILNKIAVAALQPDGSANVNTYLGLFSPAQQSYEIEVSGKGLLSPLRPDYDPFGSTGPGTGNEAVFVQGDPGRVRGLTVNQWSMQSFMLEDTWPEAGRIAADLALDGQQLQGSLRNETGFALTDAVLILGNQFTRLGDFAPGESKPVNMGVPTLVGEPFGPPVVYQLFSQYFEQPMPNGPPREVQLKQAVVESLFPYGGWPGSTSTTLSSRNVSDELQAVLLGWFDHAPPEVSIGNRKLAQKTTALLYAPLTFRLAEGERFALPAGILPGTVVQMPVDGGYCGPMGSPAVYFNRGEAVFEYRMPEFTKGLQIENLIVYVGSDSGMSRAPATALYDWSTESWRDLTDAIGGPNSVRFEDGLVSRGGDVRVRLGSEDFIGGGCFYVALGLEGKQ
jgi:hypothetical protein